MWGKGKTRSCLCEASWAAALRGSMVRQSVDKSTFSTAPADWLSKQNLILLTPAAVRADCMSACSVLSAE